jgi:hypothetical protein
LTELDADVREQHLHQSDAYREAAETEDQQSEASDRDERPEARPHDDAQQR